MKKIFLFITIILCCSSMSFSQEKDSLTTKVRLNGLSFNPTPMMLFDNLKNITLVYERMVKSNQSLVFQMGYLEISPSLLDSIVNDGSIRQKTNYGVNIAMQYRFYPTRLNAQPAPFGLYLGPYASYYGISKSSTFRISETDPSRTTEVKTNFNMFNLGIGIGYEFIFWDKFTIDLLAFGPSLTYQYSNKKSSEDIPAGDQIIISDQMEPANSSDFPLLGQFIKIYNEESSASFTTFFRYTVTFGFRF